MEGIIKFFRARWVGLALTLGSVVAISLAHWLGVFDILELKSYDYRFSSIRGPLTGWTARDSTYLAMGTDVVLVEVDDEAYRLIPEEWPYPRGEIWGRVVRNLYKAGAKVIAFDIQFDAPDRRSEYLRDFAEKVTSEEVRELIPRHGDQMLGEAIAEAQAYGTKVVLNVKMVTEPNLQPPQYIAYPVEAIMKGHPLTGLINDQMDDDQFSRRYAVGGFMLHQPNLLYPTLGLKCVEAFMDIPDTTKMRYDAKERVWIYGPFRIPPYGKTNTFLVNYYGPASGYKLQTQENVPAWGTFPRFSLAQVIDTEDFMLRSPEEDIDWMSQFLPGEIPEWIEAIEDSAERHEMMEMMGLGESFDIKQSPFYNKIVVIGVAVEVLHDVKSTPFYSYLGIPQLTPGMETHANAIQTILDGNYLKVVGSRLTDLFYDYPWIHSAIIALLALIAFFLLDFVNPFIAAVLLIVEGLIYFGIVGGLFMDDLSWFIKEGLQKILPMSFVEGKAWLETALPKPGRSVVVPLVAPLTGIVLTYISNVLYRFLNEQKDKRFLKSTFGAYISPE
ncbi:MAG: CHASE2 domain-containing protein, partial [Fidelibacterota bacterium]